MKLFRTSSIEIVKHCQEYFDFKIPNLKTNLKILKIYSIEIFCNLLAYIAYILSCCYVMLTYRHVCILLSCCILFINLIIMFILYMYVCLLPLFDD